MVTDLQKRTLRTFGGRNGRKLSSRQQGMIENSLPELRINLPGENELDPRTLFPEAKEIWLEIGFGGGEHVSGQAQRHPEIGILASEVFLEGVAKLLGQIADDGLQNIRLYPRDGRELVNALAPGSIDRVFILFPDPWPKTRHHKRRLIQPDVLDALSRIVKPNGRVRFATDVRSYADEALQRFLAHPAFEWTARYADDWRQAPDDHLETRYQTKKLGDIAPVYYDFRINSKS
ncbi:MAG: tRNA (guanosine(46)-N7)-methyltransferase TrmB [Henriciella sp.]|nr:tRNA (guanosine(46)-N7)-methyltransferase TrmB [Henriciella sp.]